MYHVEIDGISLCQFDFPNSLYEDACDNNIALFCQSKYLETINEVVDYLFAMGYNAITVEGRCNQRDM